MASRVYLHVSRIKTTDAENTSRGNLIDELAAKLFPQAVAA